MLVVIVLFLPLFAAVPAFATAPVLIPIGVLMVGGSVQSINWNDHAEAIPAFLMILMMPLTFSIPDGNRDRVYHLPVAESFSRQEA